ncbi:serine/threonine-protein kinase Sgk1-like [Ischnura elegans]|uniref:serine/threonine-protein kinase Sgk1-like n=1 Tax=Ischnura elegans TaxID=197161 RepID=UPI001ED89D3A|nr:serine/threonine-protein kinase Sgk1-like [Ischnura elegans]
MSSGREVVDISVNDAETREKNKKFTVYKVLVNGDVGSWYVFRRYNEFHKLYETVKKQFPHLNLKLPGKKLFGNNLDPAFIESRREGLNAFIQKLASCEPALKLQDVRTFLMLNDSATLNKDSLSSFPENQTSTDQVNKRKIDLGPSERPQVKPSDFEFLRVIGKGSFGKVLLARYCADKKYYAVKVLQKRLILKRNETQHIMSERNVLLSNLKHPFLVGLHISFQTQTKLYFVLDLVNGGELFFHLQRERVFSEPRSKFYASEIASALGYLHSRGVIYRDLKPENLLLDAEGHVILTDFGLCKEGLSHCCDTTSTFCGTPEYLAPEIIQKQPYDLSVDWWSLGAVVYEMLHGLPPFYSRSTSEMYENILNRPLKVKSSISEAARDFLTQLLQKDPSLRLGSGIGDWDDVRCHRFFASIDWEALLEKRIKPPFCPNVTGALDMKNIDPEFTKEPVTSSVGMSLASGGEEGKGLIDRRISSGYNGVLFSTSIRDAEENEAFAGFSYAPPVDIFP